jgi:hypothetical protein
VMRRWSLGPVPVSSVPAYPIEKVQRG